jgi:hypothetical protein
MGLALGGRLRRRRRGLVASRWQRPRR